MYKDNVFVPDKWGDGNQISDIRYQKSEVFATGVFPSFCSGRNDKLLATKDEGGGAPMKSIIVRRALSVFLQPYLSSLALPGIRERERTPRSQLWYGISR
jgi:hypothetical protein